MVSAPSDREAPGGWQDHRTRGYPAMEYDQFGRRRRGILCPRWRPLLDGPLFGAFGAYGMDGTPTPCSEMTAQIAKWANGAQQGELLEASPVQGEIGILITPETQRGTFLLSRFGAKDSYAQAVTGAYRGFFDLGYQPDFVHIDDLGR